MLELIFFSNPYVRYALALIVGIIFIGLFVYAYILRKIIYGTLTILLDRDRFVAGDKIRGALEVAAKSSLDADLLFVELSVFARLNRDTPSKILSLRHIVHKSKQYQKGEVLNYPFEFILPQRKNIMDFFDKQYLNQYETLENYLLVLGDSFRFNMKRLRDDNDYHANTIKTLKKINIFDLPANHFWIIEAYMNEKKNKYNFKKCLMQSNKKIYF